MECDRRTFLGGAALIAAGAATPAFSASNKVGGARAHTKALKSLEAYAEQHRADWGLPGLTVVVVDRDGFEGYVRSGWADVERKIPVGPDHLFQVGSITKMMTALTAWSLIEDGKLAPETRLHDALDGYVVQGGDAIALQHLLNHTAGLPADSLLYPEGGMRAFSSPGERWSYSNAGYALAGKMIANAGGALYPALVQARVFDAIGMPNAVCGLKVADRERYAQGYEPALTDRLTPRPGRMTPAPWVDYDGAAGCVAMTTGDMAIFLRFLLGLADGKGGGVFSDETATRFLSDPADAPGWAAGAKYGNGVARIEIDGRNYLHHTGGMVSFCSALHVDPDAGIAAFASTNVHYALNYRPRDVTVFACELLRAIREDAPAPTPKPTRATVANPSRYAGVFTAADGDSFEIVADSETVRLRRNGRENQMQKAADALFATTEPDFAVSGIVVDVEAEKAVRAWIGDKEYVVDASIGYKPPAPAALRAMAGRYDNDDRWAGPISVTARDGGLWIGNAVRLTDLGDGEWRYGDEAWSPERVRFDGFVNGRPQRVLFSGLPYIRRFS